jgi:hypothetical protein
MTEAPALISNHLAVLTRAIVSVPAPSASLRSGPGGRVLLAFLWGRSADGGCSMQQSDALSSLVLSLCRNMLDFSMHRLETGLQTEVRHVSTLEVSEWVLTRDERVRDS